MVAIAFGVAASANFPVLFLSMFWRGLTTRGALAGGYTGLVSAVALVCASKSVWVNVLGYADALFPYEQPALFSMPWHSPSPSSFRCWIVAKRRHRSAHDSSICMCAARPGGRERSRFALARAVDRLRRRWPEPAAGDRSTEAAVFRSRGVLPAPSLNWRGPPGQSDPATAALGRPARPPPCHQTGRQHHRQHGRVQRCHPKASSAGPAARVASAVAA